MPGKIVAISELVAHRTKHSAMCFMGTSALLALAKGAMAPFAKVCLPKRAGSSLLALRDEIFAPAFSSEPPGCLGKSRGDKPRHQGKH
jgi:hypothetical protein